LRKPLRVGSHRRHTAAPTWRHGVAIVEKKAEMEGHSDHETRVALFLGSEAGIERSGSWKARSPVSALMPRWRGDRSRSSSAREVLPDRAQVPGSLRLTVDDNRRRGLQSLLAAAHRPPPRSGGARTSPSHASSRCTSAGSSSACPSRTSASSSRGTTRPSFTPTRSPSDGSRRTPPFRPPSNGSSGPYEGTNDKRTNWRDHGWTRSRRSTRGDGDVFGFLHSIHIPYYDNEIPNLLQESST